MLPKNVFPTPTTLKPSMQLSQYTTDTYTPGAPPVETTPRWLSRLKPEAKSIALNYYSYRYKMCSISSSFTSLVPRREYKNNEKGNRKGRMDQPTGSYFNRFDWLENSLQADRLGAPAECEPF